MGFFDIFFDAPSLHQPSTKVCHGCHGYGARQYPCRNCNGTGVYKPGEKCRRCEGHGVVEIKCKRCNGTGRYGN